MFYDNSVCMPFDIFLKFVRSILNILEMLDHKDTILCHFLISLHADRIDFERFREVLSFY